MRKTDKTSASSTGNADSYAERAIAHIRAHGGEGKVLYGPAEKGHKSQQWAAWMAYFAWTDGLTTPRGRKFEVYRRFRAITVPTEWPLEFDPNAPPAPTPLPQPPPVSPERRRQLIDRLMASVALGPKAKAPPGLKQPRTPQEEAESRAYHSDRLEELGEEYAARPVRLSQEALSQFKGQFRGSQRRSFDNPSRFLNDNWNFLDDAP